jgi:hypothetical protein
LGNFVENLSNELNDPEVSNLSSSIISTIDSSIIASKSNSSIKLNREKYTNNNLGISIFLVPSANRFYYGEKYYSYLAHTKSIGFDKASSWITFQKTILDTDKKISHPEERIVIMFKGNKDTYIHIYDEDDYHVGYNHDLRDNKKIEIQIPESYYTDYKNGTKKISINKESSFEIIIENYNIKKESNYELELQLYRGNELINVKKHSEKIKREYRHGLRVDLIQNNFLVKKMDAARINLDPNTRKIVFSEEPLLGSEQMLFIFFFIILLLRDAVRK